MKGTLALHSITHFPVFPKATWCDILLAGTGAVTATAIATGTAAHAAAAAVATTESGAGTETEIAAAGGASENVTAIAIGTATGSLSGLSGMMMAAGFCLTGWKMWRQPPRRLPRRLP